MNRYTINKVIFRSLRMAGVVRATQWLTRHSPRLFMYHRFGSVSNGKHLGARDFERQLIELQSRFKLMTFGDLAEILAAGEDLPPYSAVITVDDGYEDFYQVAFPILQKLGIPASLYVTTGFIDRELWLWPDQLEYVLQRTNVRIAKVQTSSPPLELNLASDADRRRTWARLVPILLGMSNDEMRATISAIAHQLDVEIPREQPAEYRAASWEQLAELTRAGIEIGPHTRTHPSLTRIPAAQLREEIAGSKERVERMLGTTCRTFCYPNGTPDDVSDCVKAEVTAAGFQAAAVAYFDRDVLRDRLEVRRYPVGDSPYEFAKCTSGIRYLLSKEVSKPGSSPVYAS